MPQESYPVPYEFVCQSLGRILLESQFQLQQLTERIGELQKSLAVEKQKRLEAETK